ncbi:MAG: TIGR01212 family radical SAM protein [Candidatus Omnitrophota bacterium]
MRYYSFNNYLKDKYGTRVHRLGLNAGFTCPNKDGYLGTDGCIFCNEKGFSQFAENNIDLREQIESSIAFAGDRFKARKFIAYFQNATNTYAPASELKKTYDAIRDFPDIIGLFISTRPDCINTEKLDLIENYADNYEVWVEYGLQTVHDKTLNLIKRGHSVSQSLEAVKKTAERGVRVGAHVILGLPGESGKEMVETAREISKLPVSGVKLHVLHVLKNTELEKLYSRGKVELLTQDEYVSIACDFIENLRPTCVILRLVSDAREEVLVAPKWINNKPGVISGVERELEVRGTCQGIRV